MGHRLHCGCFLRLVSQIRSKRLTVRSVTCLRSDQIVGSRQPHLICWGCNGYHVGIHKFVQWWHSFNTLLSHSVRRTDWFLWGTNWYFSGESAVFWIKTSSSNPNPLIDNRRISSMHRKWNEVSWWALGYISTTVFCLFHCEQLLTCVKPEPAQCDWSKLLKLQIESRFEFELNALQTDG